VENNVHPTSFASSGKWVGNRDYEWTVRNNRADQI